MDIPVVLSHRTAALIRRTEHFERLRAAARANGERYGVAPYVEESDLPDIGLSASGLKASAIVQRIRSALSTWGIPDRDLVRLDVMVSFAEDRVRTRGMACHTLGRAIGENDVFPVARGLVTVSDALCFAQAGAWMGSMELIEWAYELCGAYFLPLDGDYAERPVCLTRDELRCQLERYRGVRGAAHALRALNSVHDGARSPMETAQAMMVSCPKSMGGLGYRHIVLNHRVGVPSDYSRYTSAPYYEIDLFAPVRGVGVEYDGDEHSKKARRGHDAERMNVLSLMGYDIKVLTSVQFSRQLDMHRAMNGIAASIGIKMPSSAKFQQAQEQLRRFVTRRWCNGS